MLGMILSFILGSGFLVLAYRFAFAKKEQKTKAFILALVGAGLFVGYAPAVQGFLKTGIISFVTKTLKEYGERLNDFQTTIGQMKTEVTDLQTKLKEHQKELESQQGELRSVQKSISEQQSSLSTYVTKAGTMQNDLASNQKTIAEQQEKILEQQRKLEDVEFLVNNLFLKTESEIIDGANTNKVIEVKDSIPGVYIVTFRLNHAPFPNSIRIIAQSKPTSTDGPFTQFPLLPPNPKNQRRNVFMIKMQGQSSTNALFFIQYTRDTREKERVASFSYDKETGKTHFEIEPDPTDK